MWKKFILCIVFLCVMMQHTGYAMQKSRAEWEKTGDIVWDVKTDKKLIALTFDDGPHPKYTQDILNILDKYQAKATFFVVGQRAKSYPALLQMMDQKGHEIANHTYTHPNMSKVSSKRLQDEIKKTDEEIYEIIKRKPTLFRPPGGNFNTKVVGAAKESHHLVVMWSWTQDTRDWSNPGTEKIIKKVCQNARPGNVVLFHDFGRNRTQTVQAVEVILKKLSEEGYEFVTVSELLANEGIRVNQ